MKFIVFKESDFNRSGLEKLLAYLEIRDLKAELNMFVYEENRGKHSGVGSLDCGSVGCLIGHGPYAGIEKDPNDKWMTYALKEFLSLEVNCILYKFLFSYNWEDVKQDQLEAAILRLKYILENRFIPYYTEKDDNELCEIWKDEVNRYFELKENSRINPYVEVIKDNGGNIIIQNFASKQAATYYFQGDEEILERDLTLVLNGDNLSEWETHGMYFIDLNRIKDLHNYKVYSEAEIKEMLGN